MMKFLGWHLNIGFFFVYIDMLYNIAVLITQVISVFNFFLLTLLLIDLDSLSQQP